MAGQLHVDQSQDDEFGPRNGCFGFLCFHCGNLGDKTGYTSLLHEDDPAKVGCWEGGRERAKKVLSQSIGRLRWRDAVNKLQGRRRRNNDIMKKRKAGFSYDSRSYRLNFNDGDVSDSIPRAADASAILKTQR